MTCNIQSYYALFQSNVLFLRWNFYRNEWVLEAALTSPEQKSFWKFFFQKWINSLWPFFRPRTKKFSNFPTEAAGEAARGTNQTEVFNRETRRKIKQQALRKVSWGGSPGLVVKEGDSCHRGCEFESQCCILDGSFVTFICCVRIVLMFEKTKNKRKRDRELPTP